MVWRTCLRPALVALVSGWGAALLFAAFFAILQRNAVFAALTGPTDQPDLEFQSRLARDLWASPLLLFVQVGIDCGILVWLVGRAVQGSANLRLVLRQGLLAGALVAGTQAIVAALLHSPWIFILPMIALLIAAGAYGAWIGVQQPAPESGGS